MTNPMCFDFGITARGLVLAGLLADARVTG
jgi:hypothetical protein